MLNERFTQLKSSLRFRRNISGNQGVIVMGALLLAITLWFLVTLNQEYETQISYPVSIDEVPAQVQIGEIQPAEIQLLVRGSGVDLLVEHLRLRRNILHFAYNNDFRRGYMLTHPALGEVSGHLSAGLTPVRMLTDSLFFAIDDRISKKVPLVHQVNIRLKPAYQLETEPAIRPDSVMVQGPRAMLDTLRIWYTARLDTEVLSEKRTLALPIVDTIPQFSINPKIAFLEIEPRLYTQLQLSLPVKIVDLPPGVNVRLEQEEIHISCLVPMEEYENLKSTRYQILIRYADIDQEVPYIMPRTDFLRQPIRVVSRSPAYIAYVIVTQSPDAS